MGRLHTRYSPVRRSPPEVLPLDLHVLGLSLAFILSQDQTLRCVLSCNFLFSVEKSLRKPTKSAYPAPLIINASHWFGPAICAGPLTCHFGILTGDPRNPFLVSHLLVRFPHRKHLNDLVPPGLRALSIRRQKNRSTRNGVLVSRKAMQNYNQFLTWQNLFTFFFKKSSFSRKKGQTKDLFGTYV